MTARVVQRVVGDRYGTPALASPAFERWCLEEEAGGILTRTYFDTKQEAESARRETGRPRGTIGRRRALGLGVGVREVAVHSANQISTFEEFAGGGCEARIFYRVDGKSRPPLPADVQAELGGETPARSSRSITRSSEPSWLLETQTELWRL
jgi:hypothetical protein